MKLKSLVITLFALCLFTKAQAQTTSDLQQQIEQLQQQLDALKREGANQEGAAVFNEGAAVYQNERTGETVRQQPVVSLRPVETGRSKSLKIGATKKSRGAKSERGVGGAGTTGAGGAAGSVGAQISADQQRIRQLEEEIIRLQNSTTGGATAGGSTTGGGAMRGGTGGVTGSGAMGGTGRNNHVQRDYYAPGQQYESERGSTRSSYGKSFNSIAIKTNLAYLVAATPSLGIEFGLGGKTSLDLAFAYNGWGRAPAVLDREAGSGRLYDPLTGTVYKERQLDHLLGKAELRLWLVERLRNSYFGFHVLYTKYDIYGVKIPLLFDKNLRYDGTGLGFGFSYGYRWEWHQRWGLEASFGLGMMSMDYHKSKWDPADTSDVDSGDFKKTYFGPTSIGVRVYFMIK